MTKRDIKYSNEMLHYLLEEMVHTMEIANLDAVEIADSIRALPRKYRKMMIDITQTLGYDTLLESLVLADSALTCELIDAYKSALQDEEGREFLSKLTLEDRLFLKNLKPLQNKYQSYHIK